MHDDFAHSPRASSVIAFIDRGMDRLVERAPGEGDVLLSLLDEITTELEQRTEDGKVAWLKPLLILHAEIEFTATRARTMDAAALGDECSELRALLTGLTADGFGARYASARSSSPRLQALHEDALEVCRALSAKVEERFTKI